MKIIDFNQYQTLVFDCDGVILNSNKVKTQAFYSAALPYGKLAAQKLVDYHVSRGGVSRYKKFEYFLLYIVGHSFIDETELGNLLAVYAKDVWQGLLSCDVSEGLQQLRDRSANCRWLVVSGGDQVELRSLFEKRNLFHLFDGGIFGSPDTKDIILSREIRNQNIVGSAIFFGDSQYDIEAAKRAGLDFVFISDWSESKFDFSDADYVYKHLGCCV